MKEVDSLEGIKRGNQGFESTGVQTSLQAESKSNDESSELSVHRISEQSVNQLSELPVNQLSKQ